MTEYLASIEWERSGAPFTDNRYSRAHIWRFDEGLEVPASASPHSVPLPLSEARAVDPEEAFVASIASCHMLWFLSIAARKGFVVERYFDNPVGVMGKNAAGRPAMTVVTLHPDVAFTGPTLPAREEIVAMHHAAHEQCYIANSVTTDVRCAPV